MPMPGKGHAFVIEADEYDRMFLGLNPDRDRGHLPGTRSPRLLPHPAGVLPAPSSSLSSACSRAGSCCSRDDNAAAAQLASLLAQDTHAPRPTGPDPAARLQRRRTWSPIDRGGFDYDAFWQPATGEKVRLAHVSLQVPGEHNVRNSLAALAVIHQLAPDGQTEEHAAPGMPRRLGEFTGTGRRFDVLGEVGGITVIDDYAHHPTEIQATLAAARARYPERRIWAVWQPHTYSRTRTLLDEFSPALSTPPTR